MRVAIIAPPWLAIPPEGYGGIESVLDGLVKGLVLLGAEVEIFGAGDIQLDSCKIHRLYEEEQYSKIFIPMYEGPLILAISHVQYALNAIAQDGGFDIIHDHNGYLGPFALEWAGHSKQMPPSLHTYHGPPFTTNQDEEAGIASNSVFWDQFPKSGRSYNVGISQAIVKDAPQGFRDRMLDPVLNAIDVDQYHFSQKKKDYFLTLARFCSDKGQHIAVKLCLEMNAKLKMAGTCASISNPEELLLELLNPVSTFRHNEDFCYYSDKILPATVKHKSIKYLGNVAGEKKKELIANAKALLFPIQWEEPFGLAVIEALASGTPVVAMNRGAMPEIIEHGVNGFLANNESEFAQYMTHVSEIEPLNCRQSVIDNFSSKAMARNYLDRYNEILELDSAQN